ncbi:MAG: pilus assembly protein TadG-related protein [Rhizobacter sp.]|nr:pilus assembly protein TadG-related protein [Rhizobacter sp.]
MKPFTYKWPRPEKQRGAIAIIVGLSMVAMIGFAGLALDGGRLYLTKTELQNAADACALAAATELTGAPNIPVGNFTIAQNAGLLVAEQNRVGFQGTAINQANVTVQFGTSLTSGAWLTAAANPPGTSRYVRCTIPQAGITPWFMQVLGFGTATVVSAATASLVPSQASCNGIPLAMCAAGSAPSFGLTPGQWYSGGFSNQDNLTGSFNWVDYSPPAGGASELAGLLTGSGACLTNVGSQVGNPGNIGSIRKQWNTRFGVYSPDINPNAAGAPVPDRSGYAYRAANWPSQANALNNFLNTQRPANQPYGVPGVANGNTITGLSVSPPSSTVLQAGQLAARGINRRIASAPIVDCAGLTGSQTVPILEYACMLMLHPIDNDPALTIYMEFIGLSSAANSPCASLGIPGGPGSSGPAVPGLVQ